MTLEIEQFNCRGDNYGVLIHDKQSGKTATIDAPQEAAILAALERRGWELDAVFTTHHHTDHVEANLALKQRFGAAITGPSDEASKIPGIDHLVGDGDVFHFGAQSVHVISTPGHTSGEISYYLPEAQVLFAGDTLFALGCGRIFEGTAQMMWESLQKLMQLPPSTAVYCGHEYTQSNAAFALSVDPENTALRDRAHEIEKLRQQGQPTLPSTIGLELETNPFLRPDNPDIRRHLAMEGASDTEVFAEIRARKDRF